ncbi:hypothetical protein L6164_002296 [Bauhinia variegata]|nr:hypothetical protein L6164_002296 [Bauhinia variegata]
MIKTLPINLTRVVLDTRKVWKVRFGRNLKGDNLQISACKLRKTSKCEGISIMGRKKDPIWDHVEKLNDKEFKCKKCGEKFAGGASRIKAHLLGIEGKGIRTCDGIPKDVQLATSSTFGDSNKAPYGTVNSCNPQHSVISNMPNDSLRGKGVHIDDDVPEYLGRATFSTIIDPNQSIVMNDNSTFFEEYFEMSSVNFSQSIMENANSYDPKETYLGCNQSITRNIYTSGSSKGKSTIVYQKEMQSFI